MEYRKNIWIISYFAGAPSYCPRVPDYNLAKYLQEKGYDVDIFAGSALHNTDINFIDDGNVTKEQVLDGVRFRFIKTRSYKTRLGEVFSFFDFYFNLIRCYKKFRKPDLVIAAMPQPLACLAGYQIARKFGVPYVTSIVDLWPLSIVEYAGFSDSNPVIQLMYKFEKWVYEISDQLVFTWEGAYDYIVDKHWEIDIPRNKFNYINIGVDLDTFYHNLNFYHIDNDDDLNSDAFKVMYCGSVRTANDIGTVVKCAEVLCSEGYEDKVKFIIYGDGPDKDLLVNYCKENSIKNVVFKGYIEKKYIPYVLSKSNLNVLNLKASATQKYGNSSNKLFEYLAAGNPVIANIDEGNYPIISKYGCGVVVEAGSVQAYVKGIKLFIDMSNEEFKQYKMNARETVKLFDTHNLNQKWETIIQRLIEKN